MVNARYPVKIHPSLSNRVSLRLATSRAAFAISPGSFGVMLTCTGPPRLWLAGNAKQCRGNPSRRIADLRRSDGGDGNFLAGIRCWREGPRSVRPPVQDDVFRSIRLTAASKTATKGQKGSHPARKGKRT
jgi:hypothetical protein